MPAQEVPPPPPSVSTLPDFWLLLDGRQEHLDGAAVADAVRQGRITRDTLVWRPGMEGWQRAGEVEALKALFAEAAPTPPPAPRFHVLLDGKQQDSLDLATVEQMVREGRITRSTLVWKPGMKGWEEAGKVPELARLFREAGPPPPPREAGFRQFLVGTWHGEVTREMGGMLVNVVVEVTYHEDGTLEGIQTYEPVMQVPGMGVPMSTTVVLTGTWKVKALGENRFALTETVTPSGANMPAMPQTSTSTITVIDQDTIHNETWDYELNRVG